MTQFNVFDLIKMTWPLWVFLIFAVVLKIFFEILLPDLIHSWENKIHFRSGKKWRSDQELLQQLRGMTPSEFENYITGLFLKLGYNAKTTGGHNDGGIDVIAEKDGITHYIQCKNLLLERCR